MIMSLVNLWRSIFRKKKSVQNEYADIYWSVFKERRQPDMGAEIIISNPPEVPIEPVYDNTKRIAKIFKDIRDSEPVFITTEKPKNRYNKDMIVELNRVYSEGGGTKGDLYIDGNLKCITIEDGYHVEKIWGDTRIPAGYYEIKFRKHGGFYYRYSKRFSHIGNKRGMLQICDVPNFKWVLFHCGNTPKDTDGCILPNTTYDCNNKGVPMGIGSTTAYEKIYPIIADRLEKGGRVFINIVDNDRE